MSDQEWMDKALCLGVDPVRMHPDAATREEVDEAKGWCASCPVFAQCAALAAEHDAYGVWAGRWWGEAPVWEVERVCFREGCGQAFRCPESGPGSRSFCSPACRTAASRARNKIA